MAYGIQRVRAGADSMILPLVRKETKTVPRHTSNGVSIARTAGIAIRNRNVAVLAIAMGQTKREGPTKRRGKGND